MIYFDNSATTGYKPPCVINAAKNAMTYLSANPGRGGHEMALKGARLVYQTRKKLASFLGFDCPERVILTPGCTFALNQAIRGYDFNGGHVITTPYEHNSVLRPLFELEKRGVITLTVAQPEQGGEISAKSIRRCITPKTKMIITTHVSNVNGLITNVREIGRLAREHSLIYLVDGAQSVGYLSVDMARDNIDMLAVAPHKGLHCCQGIGALLVGSRVSLTPLIQGGTGTSSNQLTQPSDFPEGFEAGTLNLPGIAALCAAICDAEENLEFYQSKIMTLTLRLTAGLSAIRKVVLYSPRQATGGIVTFNIQGMDSETVANILSEQYSVCVRGGLHCAPLAHQLMGTSSRGAVRASLSYSNSVGEVDFFVRAIREIAE